MNLNDAKIPTDCPLPDPLTDNSCHAWGGDVEVYFRNLEAHLVRKINAAQLVVGCVAWMTSEPILRALARVPKGVAIVVQKEDFLRPDIGKSSNWKTRLRWLYAMLPKPPVRYAFPFLKALSYGGDPSMEAVRCVGNHNSAKLPAFPRMHNKFLCFCDVPDAPEEDVEPRSVWTGSFNLTRNAGMSLENAVVLHNPTVVKAYFDEWQQIMALSETLDWRSEWIAPEWRIGS